MNNIFSYNSQLTFETHGQRNDGDQNQMHGSGINTYKNKDIKKQTDSGRNTNPLA